MDLLDDLQEQIDRLSQKKKDSKDKHENLTLKN